MDTEEWLIEQEANAKRAKEAYQLLYEIYLNIGYDDYANPVITRDMDDKIQKFFE